MKRCCKCKAEKPLAEFSKSRGRKDGLNPQCKECGKAYYAANRQRIIARALKHQKDNKESVNAKNAAWRRRNPDALMNAYRKRKAENPEREAACRREWKAANRDKVAANVANRRAKKLRATPEWRNPFYIREYYAMARLKTKMFGFKFEVDHIIPLRGDNVCGLHVETNLQVIPATDNKLKSNKLVEAA